MQESTAPQSNSISESFSLFTNRIIDQVPEIAVGIGIVILGVLLGTFIGNFIRNRLLKRTADPLMSRFLGKAIRLIFIVIAIMLGLKAAGLGGISAAILAAAGASAVVLGFAFKDIGENFIAGIILSFNRPFHINDTVEIGSNFGKVKNLEFRYTKLKSFDGKDVYIPNSDVLTQPVTNYTEDGFFRWNFVVGIAYEDDIKKAIEIITQTIHAQPDVINEPEHETFVIEDELATSTVNLKVFFWVDTTDFRRMALITKGIVMRAVKEALEQNGFYLPADIQEVKLYGKEKEFPLRMMTTNNAEKETDALTANTTVPNKKEDR